MIAFFSGVPGGAELLLLFVVILLLFGAKRLPEIARTLGSVFSDLRRASQDFKDQIIQEVDATDEDEDEHDALDAGHEGEPADASPDADTHVTADSDPPETVNEPESPGHKPPSNPRDDGA